MPDERMSLELVPGDAPEVVAVRAERAEVGRRGGAAVELLELLPAVLRRAHGMIHGREEADDAGEQRRAHEAEHDPAGPAPAPRPERGAAGRRGRTRGRRARRCREDERDRARVPHGVLERLPASVRNGSVSGSAAKAPSTATTAVGTSRRNRLPETAKTTIADTASATPPPLLCVPSQRQAIAVAPPSASARIAACSVRRAASATAGQNAIERHRRLAVPVRDREVQATVEVQELRIALLAQPDGRPDREGAEAEDDDDHRGQPIGRGAQRDERREEADGVEEREQAVVARQRWNG